MKTFSEWLKANGYDEPQLTEQQRKHLEAAWKSETAPPPPQDKETRQQNEKAKDSSSFNEKMEAIDRENARIEAVREAALAAARENVGDAEKCRQIAELARSAEADDKVAVTDFKLSLLRLVRSAGPMVFAPREQPLTDAVLEAAVCRAGGLGSLDSHFDERTLEASHKKFKNGLGLAGLITVCARQNGYRGHDFKSDWFPAVKAAFRGHDGDGLTPMAATTGPSTYSLPTIFSNVANKFMRAGFDGVDRVWRTISARRSFNDFKAVTTLALTGALQYRKLPRSGEIKHGTIGETTYSNQADTYAIMLGIDRKDLINDDLGALTSLSRKLGRGGALALNDVFWTVFLNNSSFFTSGNANVSTGGGSALGTADGAAINAAEVKFMNQTDPDGKPLGSMAKIMLVPPTLMNTAARWMGSQLFGGTTAIGDTNIFAGRYTVVSSSYMENSSYTGNSTAAWYLLADPDDLPVIEVGFLNGNESPTVETEAMEFSMLGIALRGYYDFGIALQEYRGGVRSAGS